MAYLKCRIQHAPQITLLVNGKCMQSSSQFLFAVVLVGFFELQILKLVWKFSN